MSDQQAYNVAIAEGLPPAAARARAAAAKKAPARPAPAPARAPARPAARPAPAKAPARPAARPAAPAPAPASTTVAMPGPGQTYTPAQLEQLWVNNGGPPAWAPTMAAVAMIESSGNPRIVNSIGATGLWQILSSAQEPWFNAAHPPSTMTDPNANAKAAIALLAGGPGISNWGRGTGDSVGTYAQENNGSRPLSTQQLASLGHSVPAAPNTATPMSYTLDSANTTPTNAPINVTGNTATGITVPQETFLAPEKGVNIKNFHGLDLSAIPPNELGNAEQAINQYMSAGPNNVANVKARISQDFNYHGNWIEKIPELYAVLIWAASVKDPSSAASQNEVLSAIANTSWWKSTSQYQRAWEQTLSTDPATAHNALMNAQEKVLATENQIGVQLTKAQIAQIAEHYASMSFTPAGTFSSQSGTSQEWLDQQVVDAVTAAGKGGQPNDFVTATNNMTGPGSLYGVAAELYSQLQQIAENYLLYNPSDPTKGLVSNNDLLTFIDKRLHEYTGSGASGQISQFMQGVEDQYTNYARDQAKRMYPSLAESINAGTLPKEYVAPTQTLIAQTLGLTPSAINFTSPEWSWAIATPDPKTGIKTALTQDQVLQKIVNPNFTFTGPNGKTMNYGDTNNAKTMANQFTQSIQGIFGKTA